MEKECRGFHEEGLSQRGNNYTTFSGVMTEKSDRLNKVIGDVTGVSVLIVIQIKSLSNQSLLDRCIMDSSSLTVPLV